MKNFSKFALLSFTGACLLYGGDLSINEFMASNSSGLMDPDNGEFVDWIELYNSSSSAIDLTGYTLTDSDPDSITGELDTTKWTFPSGTKIDGNSYLLVYADNFDQGLHTNFKLSSMGEMLSLFNPSKELVDGLLYPEQVADKSYGRTSAGEWVYMEKPTPNGVNDESAISVGLVDLPTMEPASGNYSSSQSVTLTAKSGSTIYYTTDGSDPTTASTKYSGSFSVSKSSTVKAIAVQDNMITSGITSKTYLIGEKHDLPIISLTAVNYEENGGPHNKLHIDGKVFVDFIETDGTISISQFVDFEASGNSSEALPQLNGKIYSKEKYGEKHFNYKMFPDKDVDKFRCFMLRNASQDFGKMHIVDGLVSRMISRGNLIDMPFEGFRPAVLYVNGKYEGIINIREDDDKYYAQANYGQDLSDYQKERVTYSSGLDIQGDPTTHEAYADFINLRQMYFHQSLLTGFCGQGEDGARIWRDSVKMTQFQYHMHDYDQAFWIGEPDIITFDPSMFIGIIRFNQSEKAEMLQFYAAQINLMYDTLRTLPLFDAVMDEVRSEIPQHAEKNKEYKDTFTGIFTSLSKWEENVAAARTYIRKRPAAMLAKTIDHNSLTPVELTHEVNDLSMGYIEVHSIRSTEKKESGTYFADFPIRLKAVAKEGYQFDRWEGATTETSDSISLSISKNSSIKAVFVKSDVPIHSSKVVNSTPLGVTSLTNREIGLTVPEAGKYEIVVYALNGKRILRVESELTRGVSNLRLNSAHLAQGLMVVEVKGMNHSLVKKVVVR